MARGAGQVAAAEARAVAGRLAGQGLVAKAAAPGDDLILYEITSQGRVLAEAATPTRCGRSRLGRSLHPLDALA